jgi:hypothetical protein
LLKVRRWRDGAQPEVQRMTTPAAKQIAAAIAEDEKRARRRF